MVGVLMSARTYRFGYIGDASGRQNWSQRISLGRGDDLGKGVLRKMNVHLGQHQTHPSDWGCNMNRRVNLWHPEDLEKEIGG